MQELQLAVQSILNVGAVAMLPIIILLLGLFFRMKFLQALKCGLLIGIGFAGLKLVISLLVSSLEPITKYYAASGSGFTIVDVGWQTLSAAAWLSPFAALVVPGGLFLNFVMIRLKMTKTLNVDIWNYWHILASAAIFSYIMESAGIVGAANYVIGFLFAMCLVVLTNYIGDKIAPWWQDYFGLEGTTCTTINFTTTTAPITWLLNKLIDRIPVVNKINISLSMVNKKCGMFGDTTIVGFAVGIFLAVITFQPVAMMIQTGVGIAAVIVLMPRMVSLLMEGLTPISKAAREYMVTKLGEDHEFYIGMDISLGLGDQTTITTALILIPITILLAFIMPGNAYFPVGIFVSINYFAAMCCMVTKGNLFRSLVIGTCLMAFIVAASNVMAEVTTVFVRQSGVMQITPGTQVVASSVCYFVDLFSAFLGKFLGTF